MEYESVLAILMEAHESGKRVRIVIMREDRSRGGGNNNAYTKFVLLSSGRKLAGISEEDESKVYKPDWNSSLHCYLWPESEEARTITFNPGGTREFYLDVLAVQAGHSFESVTILDD